MYVLNWDLRGDKLRCFDDAIEGWILKMEINNLERPKHGAYIECERRKEIGFENSVHLLEAERPRDNYSHYVPVGTTKQAQAGKSLCYLINTLTKRGLSKAESLRQAEEPEAS
jgi:hypothetical protein